MSLTLPLALTITLNLILFTARHGEGDGRGDRALPAVRGQGRGGRPPAVAGAPGVCRVHAVPLTISADKRSQIPVYTEVPLIQLLPLVPYVLKPKYALFLHQSLIIQ